MTRKVDALASLYGEKRAGDRVQTTLTPKVITTLAAELFGGRIQLDPCWAPGSHTDPVEKIEIDWPKLWGRASELAIASSPTVASEAVAIVRDGARASDKSKEAQKLAKQIRESLREEFGAESGHHHERWADGTFINPPFADKGPEVTLANFRDFCEAFAATEKETLFLCPVRSRRRWWRESILFQADAIAWLDSIHFEGHSQAFPADVCLAYKGLQPKRFARLVELAKLGTVSHRVAKVLA